MIKPPSIIEMVDNEIFYSNKKWRERKINLRKKSVLKIFNTIKHDKK